MVQINGIVVGVFCTLFVEMAIAITAWAVCKVKAAKSGISKVKK